MRTLSFLAKVSPFILLACSGTVIGGTNTGPVITPSGLEVDVAIAAATLGDEGCATADGTAPAGGSDKGSGDAAGACAEGAPCTPYCAPTSVQLAFASGSSGAKAKATITNVVLLDATSLAEVARLSPVGVPRAWNGSNYAPWDGMVSPNAALKTEHTLSSPPWSTISTSRESYSKQYRVRVTVTIEGQNTTVTSEPVNRAPQVAT